MRSARGLLLLLAAIAAGSCSSVDPLAPMRAAFAAGDYPAAESTLRAVREDDRKNAHLYDLELGMLRQAQTDPVSAVEALRQARDGLDSHAAGSFADWAGSTFLDDRSRVYPGADYEHVMVRALLGLFDLMAGGKDAYAYGLQVLEKQQEIIRTFEPVDGENPKQDYRLVAFGNYLRAIISEADPRGRHEAKREFAKVRELAPDFAPGEEDLKRAQAGRFAPAGYGVVHVIALVGRGPFRVEVEEPVTQDIINLAQLVFSVKHSQPFVPSFVPVPIPALAFHQDNPDTVEVQIDGVPDGPTTILTDVERAAEAEFAAMRRYIIARAVVRRVLKVGVATATKAIVGHNRRKKRRHERLETGLIQVGIDLLGNLWAATERADLRCWSLLPASIQVRRIELPAGEHRVGVVPWRGAGPAGPERSVRVRVLPGYNTYVTAFVPTVGAGAPPMTSRPIDPK